MTTLSDDRAWALNPWSDEPRFIRLPDGWAHPYLIPSPHRPKFSLRGQGPTPDPIAVYPSEFDSPYLGRIRIHCRTGSSGELLNLLIVAETAILFVRWIVQVGTLGLWGKS